MKKVAAALLMKDNKILIAQRKSTDKLAGKWEFPGGKQEPDETLEECLKREMNEEFGIEVRVGEFFGESTFHYEAGSIVLYAYWCTWTSGEMVVAEHDDFKWVLIEEMGQYDFAPADIPFIEKLHRKEKR
ncbi:(deoxy)nucleoside triphosphate pyrophosphohydrolase [Paenibacillus ferrarius]|uniref:(deoxy)nucleoside triphosphate pyrophosphohydrolase n=1 Tax=Paenibacillus ferrarius TaxID=1469647 RepID=UPI003D2BAB28